MIRSKLKRRLRKKFHLAEFQELCFKISAEPKPDLSDDEFDKILDAFIGEIEKKKLNFGGGGSQKSLQGVIASNRKHSSPTEKQKQEVGDWLRKQSNVSTVTIGEFRDAWYGWN